MKELNNISLPKNIRNITIETVEKAERDKKRKKRNKKNIIIASIISAMVLISSIDVNSVRAAIDGITFKIERFFYREEENEYLKDYKASLGMIKEDNKVKVILKEFFMDNETMYINAKFISEDGKNIKNGSIKNVFLNGSEVQYVETSKRAIAVSDKSDEIDILFVLDVNRVKLEDINNVKIVFNEAAYEELFSKYTTIKGNWNFEFDYDGKKVASKVVNKDINKKININGAIMNVQSIKINPVDILVKFTFGEDFKKVWGDNITLGVLDKNGELLESITIDNYSSEKEGYCRIALDTKEMENITLVPYRVVEYEIGKKSKIQIYKDKQFTVDIKN